MRILALLFALSFTLSAQTKPAAESTSDTSGHLPVKRVVLYKNGVGYFEHTGRVRGNQEVDIDFTTAQLNDVLKSLTVVDLGEGRVTGVRYNSIAPLDERLRGLRLPLGAKPTREDLLNALLGARVEVRSGAASATGKILSVETQKKENSRTDETVDVSFLSIVTDAGELRTFELNPQTSVRIAEKDLSQELNRYFGMVGSSRAKDVRRMTIATAGSGDRDMLVSYVSEVPVWKTTYRIVIPNDPKRQPLLQGWAIVDNTIGEDWKDVKLSLVAGAPQSFIQQISMPLYARRPVVALPETAQLSPQTHEAALEEGDGGGGDKDTLASPVGPPPPPPFPPPAKGGPENLPLNGRNFSQLIQLSPGAARGSDIGSGSGGGMGYGTAGGVGRNFYMEQQFQAASGREAGEPAGREIGELFSYDIKQPITIGKDQSALVPIVQARVESEKVTIWNANDIPRRALWMKNTSGATLDSGSFSIIEGDSFAGEGLLDPIKPNERRLLSYAADQSVHVASEDEFKDQPITHVRIVRGMMTVTHQTQSKRTYEIRNVDKEERHVVIEHPARAGWKLADGLKPQETTASLHRFLVDVKPNDTAKLVVEEMHPEFSNIMLSNLTSDMILLYSSQRVLKPETEQAFRRILDQKNEIAGFDAQISQRQDEVKTISNDQARVRENMKALKGSAEEKALVQRYASQMNSQEDRLATLRTEIASLQEKRQGASQQLDKMLMEVDVDEAFGQ